MLTISSLTFQKLIKIGHYLTQIIIIIRAIYAAAHLLQHVTKPSVTQIHRIQADTYE